jgi:cyclopropane-fatty-acyl-phospholipid synthase
MSEVLAYTDTTESPPVVASRAKPSLYERLFMRGLADFKHGALRLVMPDGSSRVLGNERAEITAEIRICNRAAFFQRCALYGNIGLGEAYTEGEWETPSISAVIAWFIGNIARNPGLAGSSAKIRCMNVLKVINRIHHRLRPNSVKISRRNIAEHYDLGNDFYRLWLDETMTYSAARFTHSEQTLEEAQHSKYDALCRKLRLKATDHVLEIGCGWGGFACHAAKNYGCKVTSVTISSEQYKYALERVGREGLSEQVEIRLQDYRHITGQFDKIASIEMLEAVGNKYLETYFAKCAEVLKPHGLLAVQVITAPDSQHADMCKNVDWIQKHIFPGSLLLSVGRMNEAILRTGDLFLHELEDLGSGYARTLNMWWERFNARLQEVQELGFDERFIRKWNYYLQYCEAAFAERNISVVQACYTRPNNLTLN